MLYQKGYHQQWLNPDGWQQERYPVNDFYTLPIEEVFDADGNALHGQVKLPTGIVHIKVWMHLGRAA